MRKIAIDSGPLTSGHKVRGVGVYTRELIKALKKEKKRAKGLKIEAVDFEKADLTKYDLVHYPYFNPFFVTLPTQKLTSARGRLSSGQKIVVTIHDLIPLIYPKNYPPGIQGKLKFQIQKHLLKNVDGFITVSETSQKDIIRFLRIDAQKIRVVYEAPCSIFKPITDHRTLNTVKSKYNLPSRFALYVGDVNFNKNIMGLIEACKLANIDLVICGKQAKDIEELGLGLDVLRGPSDWVRFLFNISHPELAHFKGALKEFRTNKKIIRLGFVPDDELVAIYNLASVYCQPSFYEGFGLPVLEAMASGTAVVCSKTQALVEIAGDSALFADPNNPKEMAKQINKALSNPTALKLRGAKRVKEFSWAKTANKTIDYYQQILANEQK